MIDKSKNSELKKGYQGMITDNPDTYKKIEYVEYKWTVNRILTIAFFIMLFGMMIWTRFFDKEDALDVKDRVVVHFWHGMGGVLGDVLHEMIDKYNQSQDKVYIKSQHMGSYAALNQKIIASVLAGNPPDMAQSYENWTAKLLLGDAVEKLNSYVEKEGPQFWADFFDAMRRNVTDQNNDIWSLPFNKSQQLVYYNKDLFRKAGLDPETPPATWQDVIDMGRKLTRYKAGDRILNQNEFEVFKKSPEFKSLKTAPELLTSGTAYSVNVWTYCNYLYQLGGELVNSDYTKGGFDSDEAVEALLFMIEMIDTHKMAYRTTGRQDQNDFLSEQVGFFVGSSVSRLFMEEYITFDWGMAPIPANKEKASIMSGTNVIIFKQAPSRVKQAAWDFIKWFTSPENSAYWSVKTTYMPVRKSSTKTEIFQEYLRKNSMNKAALEQLDYTCFEPPLSAWFQCRDILQRTLEDAVIEYLKEPGRDEWPKETKLSYLKKYLTEMNLKMNELLLLESAQAKETQKLKSQGKI
jgi:multiple sugar transport system substrate-binding protein